MEVQLYNDSGCTKTAAGGGGLQSVPVSPRLQLILRRAVNRRVGARLITAFLVAPSARAVAPLCSKLCSKPVSKGRIGTGQDRIEIAMFWAGTSRCGAIREVLIGPWSV
jgi:hypothetical protein